MRAIGTAIAVAAVGLACAATNRTGAASTSEPLRALSSDPGSAGALTDAELGFLILTRTKQGRAILFEHFQAEDLEYLSGHSDAYARLNPIRVSDGQSAAACNELESQNKHCKNACLAAFGGCVAGAAAGCALTGPGWPECFAFQSSAACIPAILICLKHCSDLDDERREQCLGGRGT